MFLRFAFSKVVRPNGSSFVPAAAITTNVNLADVTYLPVGNGSGAATTAPSTLVIDTRTNWQYTLNKAYSSVNAALTAVTSSSDAITIY